MVNFDVHNEFELGNAIWKAQKGDTIVLNNGKFGVLPMKHGVNYHFKNSSCSLLIGLNGIYSNDGVIVNGLCDIYGIQIRDLRIINSNVKLFYVFRKELPFNSRFNKPISFCHASGVTIRVLGNDKDTFAIGDFGQKGEDQLPKAVVDIIVPSLEGYNVEASKQLLSFLSESGFTDDEIDAAKIKRQEIENSDLNNSLGLYLNDFEYKALWALNSFIKENCRFFDLYKIKGYDVNEFKDGLLYGVGERFEDNIYFNRQFVYSQYTNGELKEEEEIELSTRYLSYQEFSISEYTLFHLNHLNYSFATLGMYQEFEALWEKIVPDKSDKWGFIESITTDADTKKYLAEMINARHWITHTMKIITKVDIRNKLKTDWNAEELNEYQIYALKRPFYWFKALNDFKIEFNNKFPS